MLNVVNNKKIRIFYIFFSGSWKQKIDAETAKQDGFTIYYRPLGNKYLYSNITLLTKSAKANKFGSILPT